MTTQVLREAVYSAFYRVVRQAAPLALEDFFEATIKETWPSGDSNPSGWPGFWEESVVVEIQNAVMARQEYIRDFEKDWIIGHMEEKWSSLIDYCDSGKLGPLS